MFYIPFIVIVDSWNVNKISISISISDLKSILFDRYVQKVNCFFSSTLYLTENTLSILQNNDISMNRSSCKMPVSFVDFNKFEF